MAKVYTMGELERARKKAQIREWVQDKKDKATNWCYAHKNEILTYGCCGRKRNCSRSKNAVEAYGTGQRAGSEGLVCV